MQRPWIVRHPRVLVVALGVGAAVTAALTLLLSWDLVNASVGAVSMSFVAAYARSRDPEDARELERRQAERLQRDVDRILARYDAATAARAPRVSRRDTPWP